MFIKIIILTLIIILALIVLAMPLIIGAFVDYKWGNIILSATVVVIGYILMISGYIVIGGGNQLSGEAEIVGIEYIPAHTKQTVTTRPVVIGGKTSVVTVPSKDFKEEAHVIHVRKKTGSEYKRYMLEIPEEEFENVELGQKVNLSGYERYD